MIVIDGKTAGGQLLRSSLGLAAVTGKSIKVTNIRGARAHGVGLRTQHLEGVLSVAQLCNAEVKGAELDSTEVEFVPGELEPKDLDIIIGTAGSISLLFQSLQIPAAFGNNPVRIRIKGGSTASAWSPPLHYSQNIFLPMVRKMGYDAEINILREGFYPRGGADVEITVHPIEKLKCIQPSDPGDVINIKILSISSTSLPRVAVKQAETARRILNNHGYDAEVEAKFVETASPGSCITMWAKCENSVLGADAIGERGKTSEEVGKEAAESLMKSIESKAAVDRYMADQLIPFIALACGKSTIAVEKVTHHCLTNMSITEKLLGVKFVVTENEIEVEGIGFKKT